MAQDIDGNYYHASAPLNYVFDNIAVVEDSDGNLSLQVGSDELRVQDARFVFTAQKGAPSTSELADGEKTLYIADGSAANSAAGDFVVARNNSGTIEESVLALEASDYSAV